MSVHDRFCEVCVQRYMPRPSRPIPVCSKLFCHTIHLQVHRNVKRALKIDEPAHLTHAQWASTVKHFGMLCAYCGERSYSQLEHYIPLRRGIGTVYGNCFPSCAHCNGRKRSLDEDAFIFLFAPNCMQAIANYQQAIARFDPMRCLVPYDIRMRTY